MSLGSLLPNLKRRFRNDYQFYFRVAPIFGAYRNANMALARLLHGIDGNMVVFSSFDGRSYNDNPRYISEALHELRPQTKIVWLFKDVNAARAKYDIPDYVLALNNIAREGVSALARARVAVDNFNKRFYLNFPARGQVYVQTWHGDRAFKKVGYDDPARHNYMLEEKCTLGVTGSDYGDMQFRSAFHYKGELMKVGYPRNDILVRDDPAERAAVRARLGVEDGARLLLYAPTYRDSESPQNTEHWKHRAHMDLSRALDALERATGERWRCLMRGHYMMTLDAPGGSPDARLIPASDYPEMAELLLAADALLTDYSSCAGDFALRRKPIYLYQDDLEDYVNNNRRLYFDMKDSPYWVASTPEELDRLIEATTPERARENCDAILKFYGAAETGHAARSVAEYIASRLDAGKEGK